MTSFPRRNDMNPAACAYAPAAYFSCANIAALLGTVIAVSSILISAILLPVSAVSIILILAGILVGDPPGNRRRYRA